MERNSAYFRRLNEQIARTAEDLGFVGFVPLLCECADPRCFRLVRTTAAEFESVLSHPERLVLLPGHEQASVETVVAETDRYTLVDRVA